jgi:small-conductance mechanosensitive channel
MAQLDEADGTCPPLLEDSTTTEDAPILRGKVGELVSKLLLSPQDILDLAGKTLQEIMSHYFDLVWITLISFAPVIIARFLSQQRYAKTYDESKFQTSRAFRNAKWIQEIGKILGLIYLVDLAVFVLDQLGILEEEDWGIYAAGIIVIVWGARLVRSVKQCYVLSIVNNTDDPARQNTARVAGHMMDVVIYGATLLAALDVMSIETGFAIKSIFGLSSFGTLVFSLASKELASEFLASLAIQANNFYKTGDQIWLGDGTQGIVQKAGWLNTLVRLGDEKVVRIPNTMIAGSRMANMSRIKLSQVTQTICLSYEDWKKLPQLSADIKQEIKDACPEVITDGSRPFRAQWREISKPYIEFTIDAKFNQAPACDGYWEMRERVLGAIFKACEANSVKWAHKDFQKGIWAM